MADAESAPSSQRPDAREAVTPGEPQSASARSQGAEADNDDLEFDEVPEPIAAVGELPRYRRDDDLLLKAALEARGHETLLDDALAHLVRQGYADHSILSAFACWQRKKWPVLKAKLERLRKETRMNGSNRDDPLVPRYAGTQRWACPQCGGVHHRSPLGKCPVTPVAVGEVPLGSTCLICGHVHPEDVPCANREDRLVPRYAVAAGEVPLGPVGIHPYAVPHHIATDLSTALDCLAMLHELLRGRQASMPVEFRPTPSSMQRAAERGLEALEELHAWLLAAYRDVPYPRALPTAQPSPMGNAQRPPAAPIPAGAGAGAIPPRPLTAEPAPAPPDSAA